MSEHWPHPPLSQIKQPHFLFFSPKEIQQKMYISVLASVSTCISVAESINAQMHHQSCQPNPRLVYHAEQRFSNTKLTYVFLGLCMNI